MAAAAESPAIRIRCRSHTRTRQGETTTCRFHTLSKMIIKAIFEDDLKLNDIENERYKRCMPLETPVTSKNNKPYSPFTCSKNGYIKIMLFYYFFYLAQQIDSSKINGPGIQALLAMPPLNPTVTEINEGSFAHLKPLAAKTPFFGYQIMLDTTELGNILEHVIIPILGLGFYLELGLVSTRAELPVGTDDSVDLDASDEEPERPSEHIVLIVGAEGDKVVIKNTWNDAENVIPFDGGIVLEKEYFKVYDLFFILPHNFGKYVYNSTDIEQVYGAIASIRPKGGKKRKTKYGQRRNHHKPKTIRASRKRTKTRYKRRLSKY